MNFSSSSKPNEIKDAGSQILNSIPSELGKQDSSQVFERMKSEYSVLQTQYNEAMNYVKQIEGIHQDITKLSAENSILKSEKDELERRLQISLQLNEDHNNKNSKAKNQSQIDGVQINFRNLLDQEKKKASAQIKELNQTITEQSQQLLQTKNKCTNLEKELNFIFTAANEKFQKKFNSAQPLVDFLQNLPVQPEETEASTLSSSLSTIEASIEGLKDHAKLYKKKYISEHRINKRIQNELKELTTKFNNKLKTDQKEIKNLTNQIKKFQESAKVNEQEHNKLVEEKNREINEIKSQLEKTKDNQKNNINKAGTDFKDNKNNNIHKERFSSPNKEDLSNQLGESSPRIKSLQDTINDLTCKLESQTEQTKETNKLFNNLKKKTILLAQRLEKVEYEKLNYQQSAKENENRTVDLTKEISDLKNQINTIQLEKDKLEMQMEYDKSQSKADKFDLSKKNSKIDELMNQIEENRNERSVFLDLLDKQKKELSTIFKEREFIVSIIQKQNALLQRSENQMNNLVLDNQNLNNQISKSVQQKNDCKNNNKPLHTNEISITQIHKNELQIPLTAWTAPMLPKELIKPILEIAKKGDIAIVPKIHSILELISKSFQKEIENKEIKMNELTNDYNKLTQQLNNLIFSVCSIIGVKEEKNSDFNEGKENEEKDSNNATNTNNYKYKFIYDRLTSLVSNNQKMTEKIETTEKMLSPLLSKLDASNISEASIEVDRMISFFEKANSRIKKQRQANRRLSEIIDTTQNESFDTQTDLEDIIKKQKRVIKTISKENEKLKNDITNLENKVTLISGDYSEYVTKQEELHRKIQAEKESKICEIETKYKSENEELNLSLSNKINYINELNNAVKESQESLKKWQKGVSLLKRTCSLQQLKIKKQQNDYSDLQKNLTDRIIKEKEDMQNKIQDTVNQWKNKNESLRNLLDKATNALTESDLQNRELGAANHQLSIEKQQLINQVEAQKQEVSREKQLSETKLKAFQLSLEIQNQSKIESELAKYDSSKRQTYSEIANMFKQFFDARQQLDEVGLKSLLDKVSKELSRLSNQEYSIKSLLGVKYNDSLEDAVTKLFYTLYSK